MGEELQLLTNSRRSCFLSCPRKHYFMYELRRRPLVESKALTFGKMFHSALELWLTGATGNVAAIMDVVTRDAGKDSDLYTIRRLHALMDGYDAMYSNRRECYTTVCVEREYRAPLINPKTEKESRTWLLAGKIDAVVEDSAGNKIIVEHKTTSDSVAPESDYWTKLPIDGQVSGYMVGAATLGFDAVHCLYDVIHKPGIKPLLATPPDKLKYNKDGRLSATCRLDDESPDDYYHRLREDIFSRPEYYFARREIVRMDDEIAEYMGDMWAVGQMIRECQRAARWPKNVSACTNMGTCPYFYVCTRCASIEDNTMFVTVDNINPELSGTGGSNGL
jgi:hypothetical protein